MKSKALLYAPLAALTVVMTNATSLLAASASDFGSKAAINVSTTANGKFSGIIYQGFVIFTWIAGIAAVFYLLLSGFQYITAGGDGDKAAKARAGIVNAIIGIVVLMAAFFIFNAARTAGTGVSSGNVTGSL